MTRGHHSTRHVHAAQGHAAVLSLDDNTDAAGLQDVLDRTRDLSRQLLLNLEPASEALDDASELGNAYDASLRQVADMRPPNDRQHVMLAATDHTNIPQDDQL